MGLAPAWPSRHGGRRPYILIATPLTAVTGFYHSPCGLSSRSQTNQIVFIRPEYRPLSTRPAPVVNNLKKGFAEDFWIIKCPE
jgi:hypothetical protein